MTGFSGIAPRLADLAIELPSWAFGNSGTRFKVFKQAGVPRDPFEKIADAAQVNRLTGLAPTVALHIPWDRVDDFSRLRRHAADLGVALGTINSNTFQDDVYKFGSLAHADPKVRQQAIDHHFACIDVMHETGSRDLKIWLADGSNYPGQADIRSRQGWLAESLSRIYERLGKSQRLVLDTSSSSPPSITRTFPTGARHTCRCWPLETGPRCASTRVITPRARTSSSSSRSCSGWAGWARSTSTRASMRMTT